MRTESRTPPAGFALWQLGFRPLYLFAAAFSAVAIGAWVAQFAGWIGTTLLVSGPLWHAHEMVFGYALAVVVGFLFTAVRNWAGRPTPEGPALAAIVGLWLAARILVPTPWWWLAAAFDVAFAVAAAVGIARPLLASGNRRNYFFIALLLGLGAVNLAFHLAMAGVIAIDVGAGLQVALDLILFIMTVMGGRVIPMFTANGAPGSRPRRVQGLERVALGAVIALVVADLFRLPAPVIATIAAVAATAHAARLLLWQPLQTRRHPILWILHAAYAWIVLHLALRGAAELGLVSASLANHALTVGAIGGLTLGMMTRTARGHTGRPLVAGRTEVAAYSLVLAAAALRVFVPMFAPQLAVGAIIGAGLLWVGAFCLFAWTFAPILTRVRADGRPG